MLYRVWYAKRPNALTATRYVALADFEAAAIRDEFDLTSWGVMR